MKCLSLFSSAGIGELGILSNNIDIICANEVVPQRCALYRENYPETKLFEGDVWEQKGDIVDWVQETLGEEELFMVYATPPCQGMSTNGAGKLKSEIAAGNRPPEDERNRLVIPAMEIINKLKPRWVLFENVPSMKDTVISIDGKPVNILDHISVQLGPEYQGAAKVLRCSDYGIPQLRKRLITIFTRDDNGKQYLHSNGGYLLTDEDRKAPVSLWDAIGDFPPLNAKKNENENFDFHPMHYVNCMNEEKYWWVDNTKEGDTAYNNQCVNPKCLFQKNERHLDELEGGKWVSRKDTPIYCLKCNELLPRPSLVDNKTNKRRLIKGFHSAYRRMERNLPARALTRNFPFEASDNKIHPEQNRVLSVYEATVLQTISDYEYLWTIEGKHVTRSLIAQAIGESVPPKLIDIIVKKIIDVTNGEGLTWEQYELLGIS